MAASPARHRPALGVLALLRDGGPGGQLAVSQGEYAQAAFGVAGHDAHDLRAVISGDRHLLPAALNGRDTGRGPARALPWCG